MGHHIVDGEFKSDKYDWCPPGFLALKFSDKKAHTALVAYAHDVKGTDSELSADIIAAVGNDLHKTGELRNAVIQSFGYNPYYWDIQ